MSSHVKALEEASGLRVLFRSSVAKSRVVLDGDAERRSCHHVQNQGEGAIQELTRKCRWSASFELLISSSRSLCFLVAFLSFAIDTSKASASRS